MKMKFSSRRVISLLLCLIICLPLFGCGNKKPTQKMVYAMDTEMTLTAYGKNADEGLSAAESVIKALDAKLDPENENSYAYLINHAGGEDVIVSSQVAEILSTAKDVYDKTGGALDLSVYPLYEAWGEFGKDTGVIPEKEEINKLRKLLNFGEMEITQFPGETNYSVKLPKGTQISFGAVAKGYTADNAIDAMRKAGVESGIISLGGNIQTLGLKPDGSNWVVAVEDPNNTGKYVGTLSVGETAVVTSGTYQRFFEDEEGNRYHHLINPDTGKPAENGLLSVTIICEDGTMADCLSTAMFILGKDAAMSYWRDKGGFEMIMITEDNKVICTSGLMEVFTLTNTDDYTREFAE